MGDPTPSAVADREAKRDQIGRHALRRTSMPVGHALQRRERDAVFVRPWLHETRPAAAHRTMDTTTETLEPQPPPNRDLKDRVRTDLSWAATGAVATIVIVEASAWCERRRHLAFVDELRVATTARTRRGPPELPRQHRKRRVRP